jgi:hypothetical protein
MKSLFWFELKMTPRPQSRKSHKLSTRESQKVIIQTLRRIKYKVSISVSTNDFQTWIRNWQSLFSYVFTKRAAELWHIYVQKYGHTKCVHAAPTCIKQTAVIVNTALIMSVCLCRPNVVNMIIQWNKGNICRVSHFYALCVYIKVRACSSGKDHFWSHHKNMK